MSSIPIFIINYHDYKNLSSSCIYQGTLWPMDEWMDEWMDRVWAFRDAVRLAIIELTYF